ncbi:DUF2515 domain-containing protein [Bacillus sp. FJAT-49705]|uniref:DUF2515 domain-containing protein n=1 Tax=Cytobacillus citreus TaxID=2833586 RepID=A0ABS5NPQ2_9BACI|nr:DUF2515 domain-containing protein [Cytobacillus citreus]
MIFSKLFLQKDPPLSESLIKIKKELKRKTRPSSLKTKLSHEEERFVHQIKYRTSQLNINNVTRTKAYLDFYLHHPEVHWAFLGHMVSRNGGWNMTDLKGGMLSRLLSRKEKISFFSFLERGNWLIFQDAFPQFMLYEESLNCGKNLFYLLPHLNVSTFMETIWSHFFSEQDPYFLTIALVINEQSYLESRVLQNPLFKKNVFNTLEFKIQDFLSMNHVLFPYYENEKLKLIGQTLHHFENLHERILFGKRLYAILYGEKDRLQMVEKWAIENPHTGSRKDYWPQLFNTIEEGVPEKIWKPKIRSCNLIPGASRIFSPRLEFAWRDTEHESAELGDWYNKWKVIYYLTKSTEKVDGEIENEYCKTLERLEFAAITKKVLSYRE